MHHKYIARSLLLALLGMVLLAVGILFIIFSNHMLIVVKGTLTSLVGFFLIFRTLNPDVYEGSIGINGISWKVNDKIIGEVNKSFVSNILISENKTSSLLTIVLIDGNKKVINNPHLFFGSLSTLKVKAEEFEYTVMISD